MAIRNRVHLYLNGTPQFVGPEHAGMMLADYLRQARGLMGTKIVCAEGDCGACSVLQSAGRQSSLRPQWRVINSCVATVAQMDCSSLVTVDALKGDAGITQVQSAMLKCHGSQCGFCTPGFVMALTGLVENKLCGKQPRAPIGEREAKNAMTGNLCRCTGYQPIVDAATSIKLNECSSVSDRFWSRAQEKSIQAALVQPLFFEGEGFSFFAPTTLKTAAEYLKKNKKVRVLAGGTDMGVLHNKRKVRLEHVLSLHLIPELYEFRKLPSGRMEVGARVSLTELREKVKKPVPELARFLDLFASPQIKNVATLAGNIANASPIGDCPPFLLVSDAKINVWGPKGKRAIKIEEFYRGYRKTALAPGEFIVSIQYSVGSSRDSLALYKVSQRKDLDISTINAAFRVQWSKGRIKEISVAMGGVAAIPLRLRKTEAALRGQALSAEVLKRAAAVLHSEMKPLSDLRASSAFRRVVAENLLRRFFREHDSR